VYLEVGTRRTFACSLDWPGWCRAGKDEDRALEALAAYRPRYAVVAEEAGVAFRAGTRFELVERLPGSATTDFGAPDAVASADATPLSKKQAERLAALVAASWVVLDRVADGAPATLRKGPRGGGRDRDAVVQHVADSQASYSRSLGVSSRGLDTTAVRRAVVDALRAACSGTPAKGWPPRYAARRIAWHVLDHAWEIEDRSGT